MPGGRYDDYAAKILTNAEVFFCLSGGKIVALIAFYCNDFESRQAYVTMLAVNRDHRRRGFAERLLLAAIAHAREAGFRSMKLAVHTANEGALGLYCKLGFGQPEPRDQQLLLELQIEREQPEAECSKTTAISK